TTLYEIPQEFLTDYLPTVSASQLSTNSGDTITLEFLTPTRIKYRDRYINDLEFHILIRNLLRRISMLMLYHCNTELDADVNELIEKAKSVEVKNWDLDWHDNQRYSTRQKRRMKLGGVVGKVTYQGNLEPFIHLLALGEQVHVGKGTTFGLGRYIIFRKDI
ncbi:CRISPR system precrRNA processing endoribonuclease RAMP protein Cas6, partial [Candidatus Poribacteria bacterium]|nr:CRISPR system precrRNA processing endoribonuclease RAMP protein Cas6 [Candidatus Poribacteria bacterium]